MILLYKEPAKSRPVANLSTLHVSKIGHDRNQYEMYLCIVNSKKKVYDNENTDIDH